MSVTYDTDLCPPGSVRRTTLLADGGASEAVVIPDHYIVLAGPAALAVGEAGTFTATWHRTVDGAADPAFTADVAVAVGGAQQTFAPVAGVASFTFSSATPGTFAIALDPRHHVPGDGPVETLSVEVA